MGIQCNFLFVEGTSGDNITTLYPITIKIDGEPVSIRALGTPRIEYSANLPIKHLITQPRHNKNFVIVGAGPTLYGFMDELFDIRNSVDNTVCSINRTHEFLIKRNIIPDIHVFYERDINLIEQSLGGQPHRDVTYYVCSMCDENIFKQLKDYKCVLWHTEVPNGPSGDYHQLISLSFPNEPFVGVGPTSFLKSFGIGQALGFTNYEIYGIDCSFPISGSGYVNEYEEYDPESRFYLWASGKSNELRRYCLNNTLLLQTIDFMKHYKEHKDLYIRIHGDGLLGFVVGGI